MITHEYKPVLPATREMRDRNKYAWMKLRQAKKLEVAKWRDANGLDPVPALESTIRRTPSGGIYR